MQKENQSMSSTSGDIAGKYLTFMLSSERYGVAILKVQEIISVPNITRVPRCSKSVKGVINLRGRIVPIVDLRTKMGLPAVPYNEKSCVIVVNIRTADQTVAVGMIVDTVLEVIDFQKPDLETAPDYGTQIDARFIMALGRKGKAELSILIDVEKSLSDVGTVQVQQLTN